MLFLVILSAFSIFGPQVKATTEIAYDDGTSEVGPAWNVAGGMFAVQFTAPFYPVKILEMRIFFHALNNPSDPIRVHLFDEAFNDLTEPIDLTVYQEQAQIWISVDVSSRNIILLSGDFYIASEQLVAGDPDIGSDTSSTPQGRSWEFNGVSWYPQPGTNYMLRVLIGPAPVPVGGIWTSINKFELLVPYIGLASLIAIATISIVYVKYRKKKQT